MRESNEERLNALRQIQGGSGGGSAAGVQRKFGYLPIADVHHVDGARIDRDAFRSGQRSARNRRARSRVAGSGQRIFGNSVSTEIGDVKFGGIHRDTDWKIQPRARPGNRDAGSWSDRTRLGSDADRIFGYGVAAPIGNVDCRSVHRDALGYVQSSRGPDNGYAWGGSAGSGQRKNVQRIPVTNSGVDVVGINCDAIGITRIDE